MICITVQTVSDNNKARSLAIYLARDLSGAMCSELGNSPLRWVTLFSD
ncbi:MAG: hypothetical protein KKD12_06185 [Proteobacteria bacterium]|nr:hypothetical protein [Pseudomonadota bacterium]MBU4209244.1 hypothetical protein [Pseudomonadota bacterium]MBU4504146.1 hypothetical protein [Pseudomonadota bacterium]